MSEAMGIREGMPAELLPVVSIRREASLWPRRGLNLGRVREFAELYRAEGVGALPPVLVAVIGEERYLADGWHRCAAAMEAGLTEIAAQLGRVEQVEQVFVAAVATSSHHGQPLTREEKRRAVDRLLTEMPEVSDRGLARLAGVSAPFVSRRRERLTAPGARKRGPRRVVMPAERAAARVVKAMVDLERLAMDLQALEGGERLDPARALAAAAGRRREDGAAVLARLERWAARARGLVEDSRG
jgi:ParB-like chromosome segregation protein Spo0J